MPSSTSYPYPATSLIQSSWVDLPAHISAPLFDETQPLANILLLHTFSGDSSVPESTMPSSSSSPSSQSAASALIPSLPDIQTSSKHDFLEVSKPGSLLLTDLPFEILLMVTEKVDKKSLKNLRLACTILKKAAVKLFDAEYIINLRVVISPTSFSRLLEITSHPDIGRYIQSISLGDSQIDLNPELARELGLILDPDVVDYNINLAAAQKQLRLSEGAKRTLNLCLQNISPKSQHMRHISIGTFHDLHHDVPDEGFGAYQMGKDLPWPITSLKRVTGEAFALIRDAAVAAHISRPGVNLQIDTEYMIDNDLSVLAMYD